MRTIKTNNTGTGLNELIKEEYTPKVKKEILRRTDTFIQIDIKSINAEAMEETLEEAEIEESFIPELDTKSRVVFKEMLEDKIYSKTEAITKDFIQTVEAVNKKYDDIIMQTEYTKGNYTAKTKYFFDKEEGIIMAQMIQNREVTTYKVGKPTVFGLTAYRIELNSNESLANEYEELRTLHNDECLVAHELEPESEKYFELAEDDKTKQGIRNFNTKTVYVNFYHGLIQYVLNRNEDTKQATPQKKKAIQPSQAIADIF